MIGEVARWTGAALDSVQLIADENQRGGGASRMIEVMCEADEKASAHAEQTRED